ncbi:malto-oligosyltrehalose synthase [Dyella sp.]|uniref:malto-oligosyltrehalose synthase n=1 Tax=Dyella sp. TaxID=1869338 RepID=UPI002ECFB8B3
MTELTSTARIQLHSGFDFDAAAQAVPYYARLGISHFYLSPIARAREGSTHGYDVVDPGIVNPELGGEDALGRLIQALHRHDMGAIVDIVPNHMAADTANPWWRDVLQHGRDSRYASFFDIEWDAPHTQGKIWLPVLGEPLDTLLERGELSMREHQAGSWELAYGPLRFPLSDTSQALLQEEGLLPGTLRRLLALQHYRLAWWRSSADVVNYRRFFDIDGLVALAMNRPDVFQAVHALPLRLIERGWIDGLRVDHVDGIANPRWYLRRLRREVEAARQRRGGETPVTIHVEKILAAKETVPASWPVQGSTGYDFMDWAGALLHSPVALPILSQRWHECSGRPAQFREEERTARLEWMRGGLHTDLSRCLRQWERYLACLPEQGDITVAAVGRALMQVLEHMPVYRSYLGPGRPSRADRAALNHAFEKADSCNSPDDHDVRQWLRRQLLEVRLRDQEPVARTHLRRARQRFEQLSAPLNAKAVEDTAGYRYGALLSRNEVGSDPSRFALSIDGFHRAMEQRAAQHPLSLSATATHDHKRGEDARARLALLSERPIRWAEHLARWIEQLRHDNPGPSAGDVAMLLQTAIAAWSPALKEHDDEALAVFGERLESWWMKALREARCHTRWTAPDARYEARAQSLVRRLFGDPAMAPLRDDIARTAHGLDAAGALNGLVVTTLRLTTPGIPDLYQGTDYWDQSLVDPDNRRDVDYAERATSLRTDMSLESLLSSYRNGHIKQALLARLLAFRRAHPDLMRHGDYQPWRVTGAAIGHVLAFGRSHGDQTLIVAVPLHTAHWLETAEQPRVQASCWGEDMLLPDHPLPPHDLVDVLTGQSLSSNDETAWRLSKLFANWPVAVLHASMQAKPQ